jgi:hypothetical protein
MLFASPTLAFHSLVYRDTACQPMIDLQITKLAIKGYGIRDTTRIGYQQKHRQPTIKKSLGR